MRTKGMRVALFAGTGAGTDVPPSQAPAAASGAAEGSVSQALDVDSTKPTTSLQIRLSDGTRLTGHTSYLAAI